MWHAKLLKWKLILFITVVPYQLIWLEVLMNMQWFLPGARPSVDMWGSSGKRWAEFGLVSPAVALCPLTVLMVMATTKLPTRFCVPSSALRTLHSLPHLILMIRF